MRRCFACGKPLPLNVCEVYTTDRHSDGRHYKQWVGPDCFKRAKAAGSDGWPTPRAGMRVYFKPEWAQHALENMT